VKSKAELSELLVDLYAAPLQRDGWQVFFDRLCSQLQLSVGYLHCCRPGGRNFVLAGGGANFTFESIDLYNRHYAAHDPHRAPLDAIPRVGPIKGEELISRRCFLRSELYNDLLSRHDAEYLTVLATDSDRETTEVFSLYRGKSAGPIDGGALRQLAGLVPHVRNAFALQAQLSDAQAFRLLSEAVMESMSIAALQVTRDGRVKYANRLAVSYLRDGDGLRQGNGFLFAVDPETNQRLYALIANATKYTSEDSPHGGALCVLRRKAATAFQVTVVPAPREHRLSFFETSALVFIADPASEVGSRSQILQRLYGLTPTEARLASLLVEGLEVRAAAQRMSMSYETARFHLKRVMNKTGIGRQTELIRLVLSLPGQSDTEMS
jgi:DNA-binding CsgD family transcriptional regulator/PAS domain-containing protein